jgi:hypothetical protein
LGLPHDGNTLGTLGINTTAVLYASFTMLHLCNALPCGLMVRPTQENRREISEVCCPYSTSFLMPGIHDVLLEKVSLLCPGRMHLECSEKKPGFVFWV